MLLNTVYINYSELTPLPLDIILVEDEQICFKIANPQSKVIINLSRDNAQQLVQFIQTSFLDKALCTK